MLAIIITGIFFLICLSWILEPLKRSPAVKSINIYIQNEYSPNLNEREENLTYETFNERPRRF